MNNRYYILRHGQTTHQVEKKGIVYFWPEDKPPAKLTKTGKEQVKSVAEKLKNEKIDLIFSSDTLRTRQTSEIVAKKLGLKVLLDKRLRDINWGIYQGKSAVEPYKLFYNITGFSRTPLKGENWLDCQRRMLNVLQDLEKQYKGKTILIVSHSDPLWLLLGAVQGLTKEEMMKQKLERKTMKVGELQKLE